jgi:hypothetical protein
MKKVKTEVKKLLAKIVIGAHVFKPRLQKYRTRPNSRPTASVALPGRAAAPGGKDACRRRPTRTIERIRNDLAYEKH